MFLLPGFICGLTAATRRIHAVRGARHAFARACCVPPRRRPNPDTIWWTENGSSEGLRARGILSIRFPASIAVAPGVQ
jgi:hypothetical protein